MTVRINLQTLQSIQGAREAHSALSEQVNMSKDFAFKLNLNI